MNEEKKRGRPKKSVSINDTYDSDDNLSVNQVDTHSSIQLDEFIPKAVIMLKTFVLSLKMPNQSAHITSYFREGQKIYSPDTIKHLKDHNAPILAIS